MLFIYSHNIARIDLARIEFSMTVNKMRTPSALAKPTSNLCSDNYNFNLTQACIVIHMKIKKKYKRIRRMLWLIIHAGGFRC